MKRKMIALAASTACAAPAAMAQTATPVTLYGRIHATLEFVEAKGGAAPVARRTRVTEHGSLLGVRGSEVLGGGLKALFQLETAFKPDQNDSTFAARNSGVGLEGAFGTVMMGRWDTPFKIATTNIDPLNDVTIGGTTAATNDRSNFDRREQNVVQYWSPVMGGFALRLSYAANEGKGPCPAPNAASQCDPYAVSGSVTYTARNAYAFFTYEVHEDQLNTNARTAAVTPGATEKGAAAGGTYQISAFRIGGMYQEFRKTGLATQKAWMANLVYTMGRGQLIYQHQNAKNGLASSAALQPACDVDSLGWQYNFSRRTFFLALYSKTDNNAVGACNFGNNPLGGIGQDPQGVSLGLRHVF